MDLETQMEAQQELGSEIVDLTAACLEAAAQSEKDFWKLYISGQRYFELSFTSGVIYTVKVLGESDASEHGDRKMDVEIVKVSVVTGQPPIQKYKGSSTIVVDMYRVGHKRWVRCYDLKPEGHYEGRLKHLLSYPTQADKDYSRKLEAEAWKEMGWPE